MYWRGEKLGGEDGEGVEEVLGCWVEWVEFRELWLARREGEGEAMGMIEWAEDTRQMN